MVQYIPEINPKVAYAIFLQFVIFTDFIFKG
jgi:hypothetical protein